MCKALDLNDDQVDIDSRRSMCVPNADWLGRLKERYVEMYEPQSVRVSLNYSVHDCLPRIMPMLHFRLVHSSRYFLYCGISVVYSTRPLFLAET